MVDSIFNFIERKRIQTREELDKKYTANTIGVNPRILGAVIVESKDEIIRILKVANSHKIAIYPISSGKNWGYGSAIPPHQDSVIRFIRLKTSLTTTLKWELLQ